jgi:hypothetical protein
MTYKMLRTSSCFVRRCVIVAVGLPSFVVLVLIYVYWQASCQYLPIRYASL